jgi:hypothetical protein
MVCCTYFFRINRDSNGALAEVTQVARTLAVAALSLAILNSFHTPYIRTVSKIQ